MSKVQLKLQSVFDREFSTVSNPASPPKVLVMEDNPTMLEHLLDVLSFWDRSPELISCSTIADSLALISSEKVDLLIADIHLPDGVGTEVISRLRELQPEALSVVFSALNERTVVLDAIKQGASGYIYKEDAAADILHACEEVLAGGSPMSAGIARLVIESLQNPPIQTARDELGLEVQLTPREQDVLQALSRGFKNNEIAELLAVSQQTIPVHIRNIYRKLAVKSRTEAVFEARRMGLLE